MTDSLDVQIPWPGWRAVKRLGRGSYGSVWEIERNVAGELERCALKVIGVPPRDSYDDSLSMGYDERTLSATYSERADDVLREYQFMAELSHPNVVSCKDVEKVARADTPGYDVFIRMELLTPFPKWAGERSVSEIEVARMGRDVARALAACEQKGIVHRDVKPANIMVDDYGTFKLGDFGIARSLDGTRTATSIGTEDYMAPEVSLGQEYGRTVDIYSLGLVMYWALNGYRLPFMQEGSLDAFGSRVRRLRGDAVPAPTGCSPNLARIVLKACAYQPQDRYQHANEIVSDLEEFLAGEASSCQSTAKPSIVAGRQGQIASQTVPNDSDWGETTGVTIGRGFGTSTRNASSPHDEPATVGRQQTHGRPSLAKTTPATRKAPKPVEVPAGKSTESPASKSSASVSRRGFIVGGVAAAVAAGAFLLSQDGDTDSGSTSSEERATISEERATISTDSLSSLGNIAVVQNGTSDEPWVSCDYSAVTTSRVTSVMRSYFSYSGGSSWFVLRCEDGSTLVFCCPDSTNEGVDADEAEMMGLVSAWSNLRKLHFADYDSTGNGDDKCYALGQGDDGSFVTTRDELAEGISSDTSGMWSQIADFTTEAMYDLDIIATDGSRWSYDVYQRSFDDCPAGSVFQIGSAAASEWPDKPALAFPTNGGSVDIILMQDGTCWSTYGEGDARGEAIRSWTDIVQCVDGVSVYAAIGSDGTVHATPNYLDGEKHYERYRQCADELSSWSGINKLDAYHGEFIGVTSGGNVLYGRLTSKNDQYLFRTYDLGLSGVIDAALGGYSLLTIDESGTVKVASIFDLVE